MRFSDDLDEDINYIVETSRIPEQFKDNNANVTHLTTTIKERNEMIK